MISFDFNSSLLTWGIDRCSEIYDPVMDEAKVYHRGSVALVFCVATCNWAGAIALAGGCAGTG